MTSQETYKQQTTGSAGEEGNDQLSLWEDNNMVSKQFTITEFKENLLYAVYVKN